MLHYLGMKTETIHNERNLTYISISLIFYLYHITIVEKMNLFLLTK